MAGLLPQYTHVIDPKLKHTYLSFDDNGELLIKSPKVPIRYIENLLIKKAQWIKRSQNRIQQKKGRNPCFSGNDTLYYLGKSYPLLLQAHEKKRITLSFNSEAFLLQYHTFSPELFQKHIDIFYKQEAKSFIPPLVQLWADRMQLSYGKIRFRKTRRQWGSCSSKNDLSFNTMLMKLPKETIEYVIIHELAHIQYKHHQKSFWQFVETTLPEYKNQVSLLHTFTPS